MIFVLMEGADVCNVYLNCSWLKQFIVCLYNIDFNNNAVVGWLMYRLIVC